jgi:uncharacterized protein YbjT (DUF2867 family)
VERMIVLTTPTGQIGSAVLARLRHERASLRVIARDPSRLPAHVSAVAGSHRDPAVLDAALAGADALFWLVPPDPAVDSVGDYYREFTAPACEAIVRHQVPRVVVVSTLGDGRDAGTLTAALEMEQQLRRTGAAVRSLRLPFFMENLLRQRRALATQGSFSLTAPTDRPLPLVSTDDAGAVAAALLLDTTWTGQSGIPVIGSDDLTPIAMANVMTNVLGRPISYVEISLEVYAQQLREHGASPGAARDLVAMAAAIRDGFYDRDPYLSRTRRGESFAVWCERVLAPALASGSRSQAGSGADADRSDDSPGARREHRGSRRSTRLAAYEKEMT